RTDKIVRIETQGRGACRRGRGAREVEGRPDVPLQGEGTEHRGEARAGKGEARTPRGGAGEDEGGAGEASRARGRPREGNREEDGETGGVRGGTESEGDPRRGDGGPHEAGADRLREEAAGKGLMEKLRPGLRGVAERVARSIDDGTLLGLGSGSTVARLLEELSPLLAKKGVAVRGVPTSTQIEMVATKNRISIVPFMGSVDLV